MQLLLAEQKLYLQYEETIKQLEEKPSLQPRKKQMPIYMDMPLLLAEILILAALLYLFFLIVQLALFNLVIIGILIVFFKTMLYFFESLRKQCKFRYRTKDFINFIDEQNAIYSEMGIEIQYDREGNWLEFLLKEEEKMFEDEIAIRRQAIFNDKDTKAIEEMKTILHDYSKQK